MQSPLKILARFLGLEELRELDKRAEASLRGAHECLARATELNRENRTYLERAQKYYEDAQRLLVRAEVLNKNAHRLLEQTEKEPGDAPK